MTTRSASATSYLSQFFCRQFAIVVLAAAPCFVQAQSDDFSDGNDTTNPTWTHNSGYVNSSGQSWTVANGSYRLQAPNNGLQTYGYIGSFVGAAQTAVRASADFINFTVGMGGAFGLGVRLNSANTLGSLNGYGYAYEPFANSLNGEMVLYRINDGVDLDDLSSFQVSLDPNKDYTFVLSAEGANIYGAVFEVGGGMVAENLAVDSMYTSGVSGVFGYSQGAVGLPPTDFTIDNFLVQVPEPSVGLLAGMGVLVLMVGRRLLRARQ